MIKAVIDTKRYCENCPNFSANCEQNNSFIPGERYDSYVIITCKHKGQCEYLKKYLSGCY